LTPTPITTTFRPKMLKISLIGCHRASALSMSQKAHLSERSTGKTIFLIKCQSSTIIPKKTKAHSFHMVTTSLAFARKSTSFKIVHFSISHTSNVMIR
jgi:hypothetical protein